MENDNFFIKSNYSCNSTALTNDEISSSEYWTRQRINYSRFYQYPVYKYATHIMQEKRLTSLVDVGCGPGTKLLKIHRAFPNLGIAGIDQRAAIEYCKRTYNFGKWFVDNFDDPDVSLHHIKGDLVICADVIEHVVNPDVILNYLKNKLAPKGYIILSTPERDVLRGKDCTFCPNPHHIREWNYTELAAYLRDRGFFLLDHFLQMPIPPGFSRLFAEEVLFRLAKGHSAKYNQVCLLQLSS